jgi:hypothetical protein
MVERMLREPTLVLEAVRQLLLFAALMGWLALDEAQLAAAMMALSSVLALVNRALVEPTPREPLP